MGSGAKRTVETSRKINHHEIVFSDFGFIFAQIGGCPNNCCFQFGVGFIEFTVHHPNNVCKSIKGGRIVDGNRGPTC